MRLSFWTSGRIPLCGAVWLAMASFAIPAPALAEPARQDQQAEFDIYVEKAMAKWGVPGVAIGLLQDGKIVRVKGYGVKKFGEAERVDGDTLFAIASLTKAFTAAAIATLSDEERLSFDDPVTKYLPDLKLYDSKVTAEVTIRDLLAQRTCLQSKDLLTWDSPFSREETRRRLQYLPPACSFRDRFVYNNINYVLAGDASAAAAGSSWQALIKNRLLVPLDMNNSATSSAEAARARNLASPHIKTGGKLRLLPLYDEGISAPAGAIHSTAADMARWVELLLGGGAYLGKTIWSPTAHAAMLGEQMAVRPGPRDAGEPPTPIAAAYGFGWGVGEYRGRRFVEHTGQSDGMYAMVAMMPNDRLGIVVLTNSSMVGLPEALAYHWLDDQLGVPEFDWIGTLYARAKESNDAIDIDNVTRDVLRKAGTKPSLPATGYAGVYRQDLLGDVTVITAKNGEMSIRFLTKTGRLKHWQDDMFQIDWGGDPYYTMTSSFVTFQIGVDKQPISLKIGGDEETFVRSGSARIRPKH